MATEYEISTGNVIVPTTGDKLALVRLVMGVWTPYTFTYESTLVPSGGTAGSSLLSARADHTHSNYIAKVAGGTAGHVAVLASDGSIVDGGALTSTGVVTVDTVSANGRAVPWLSTGGTAYYDLTITADCPLTLGTAVAALAQRVVAWVRQDSTGGHTVTWPSVINWANSISPPAGGAANSFVRVELETLDGGATIAGRF